MCKEVFQLLSVVATAFHFACRIFFLQSFPLVSANGYSLVECELETGKKNQIRVHMADLKTPVAGDTKYGASTNPVGRLALHAAGISFNHPLTHEPMSFELPVPNKFLEVLKKN